MMLFRFISSLFLFLVLAMGAVAQTKPADNIRLTMNNLRATITAYVSTIQLVSSDSTLIAKLKTEEEKAKQENSGNSFSLATKHLAAADPRFRAAFSQAGITPELAGLVLESLLGAALADGLATSAPQQKTPELPPVAAANLAFYRQHKTEITALLQEFQAAATKANSLLEARQSGQ